MTSGYAVATLVVFIISIFFVIRPVSIPIPYLKSRIPINLTTAPILAIALLWAAQCLDPTVIRTGIVGSEGVKPYNILILFFSLAYMAITLDTTGILRAAAFWVSNKGGYDGWKLYFYFYIMLTLLSILLGNDPVILSGTAFLVYYTQVAELSPLAWMMAEFAAANTASMVLFVGNPTNVVICEGFSINNAAFTAYTIIPFIVCNVFCFVALAFQYRKQVPRKLAHIANLDPRSALTDRIGAWVGSCMLGATLILCLVVSFFGIDVWMISLPFAFGKFLFDLGWDYYRYSRRSAMLGRGSGKIVGEGPTAGSAAEKDRRAEGSHSHHFSPARTPLIDRKDTPQPQQTTKVSFPADVDTKGSNFPTDEEAAVDSRSETLPTYSQPQPPRRSSSLPSHGETAVGSQFDASKKDFDEESQTQRVGRSESFPSSETSNGASIPGSQPEGSTDELNSGQRTQEVKGEPQSVQDKFGEYFPTLKTALPRLPFGLVPFAFSQFILIEALNHQGWVDVFANWLVRASHRQTHPTIWLIGVLGVVLCNLSGTNIGATILLTKVIRAAALPHDANLAAAIALAISSNIGAVSFTFSASLAGLLWQGILSQKGITVRQRDFAFWNLLPILVMTTVGLGIASAEVAVLFGS